MSLKFRIPKDHPKAPKIKRMFECLATRRRLSSGLCVETGRSDDRAVEEVMAELRGLLAEDGIDLDAEVEKVLGPRASVEKALSDPRVMHGLVGGLLGAGKGPSMTSIANHLLKR